MKPTSIICAATLLLTGAMAHAADFSLHSTSLQDGARIGPQHYWNNFGCKGDNVMPDLNWRNAPAGTKSFAVTFYDQDAPTGSGFWHWVAYDIAGGTTSLPGGVNGGALPTEAVQGNTDLGTPGFFGPCPPVGRLHRYVYTVHALKVEKLPLAAGATAALVGFNIWLNSLGSATLQVHAGPRP